MGRPRNSKMFLNYGEQNLWLVDYFKTTPHHENIDSMDSDDTITNRNL